MTTFPFSPCECGRRSLTALTLILQEALYLALGFTGCCRPHWLFAAPLEGRRGKARGRPEMGQLGVQLAFSLPCRKAKEMEKPYRPSALHSSHGDGTTGSLAFYLQTAPYTPSP